MVSGVAKLTTLLQRQFRVKAPVNEAWDHLANVERWPSWARHIRRIEMRPPGPLTSSSAGTIHLSNGVRSTFKVEELNDGHNWKWAGLFLWLTVHYDHRFRAINSTESEIVFVLAGEGFGVGTFGRLFALIYARNLDHAIPRLIDEIEREAG